MAQINNSDVFKELRDGAKIQQLRDSIPSQLAEKVVPVMEVNPKLLRRSNIQFQGLRSSTGTLTAYTTPIDRDFYLTEIQFSMVKNATCDQATGALTVNATQDGASRRLVGIAVLALTAERADGVITLDVPIKLDRNTTIALALSFTVGAESAAITGSGYTVENSNA